MKTIHNLLNERKQLGTIYHFTTLISAIKIIETDSIKGGFRNHLNGWAVSFTRDKNFDQKGKRLIGGTGVTFVIDGDKLTDKYKIKSHQYLGTAKDPGMIAYRNKVGDEMEEELILRNKKILEGFSKYIIKAVFNLKQIQKEEMTGVGKDYLMKLFNYENFEEDDIYTVINSAMGFFEKKNIKIEIKK